MIEKDDIIYIILIIAIGIGIYFTYYSDSPITEDNMELRPSPEENDIIEYEEVETIEDYSYDDYPHLTGLHWGKMPIMYYIKNPETCTPKVVGQIEEAFAIIQNETDDVVSFEQEFSEVGISIECFHRYGDDVSIGMKSSSTYAYAGVTYVFDDELGNVIYGAEVTLHRIDPGKYYGRCGPEPVTIIHEILHVFNFEDNGDSDSIMYRYIGICDMDIDEKIIEKLKKDYTPQSQ